MKNYKSIIERLSKKHKITPIFTFKDDSGTAFPHSRRVKIPKKIDSEDKALVSFHEIAHVIMGDRKPTHYEEYLADRFAIRTGRKHGIFCEKYEKRARLYTMFWICEDIDKQKFPIHKIKKSVIRFVSKEFDFSEFRRKLRTGYYLADYRFNCKKLVIRYRKSRAKSAKFAYRNRKSRK